MRKSWQPQLQLSHQYTVDLRAIKSSLSHIYLELTLIEEQRVAAKQVKNQLHYRDRRSNRPSSYCQ